MAKQICRLMDEINPQHKPHEQLIRFVTDRLGHDWRYAIDISKIKRDLGWQPSVTFDAGLRKTLAYYT